MISGSNIMQKDAKNDEIYHFSELFYDFSWVVGHDIFMKNHEIRT